MIVVDTNVLVHLVLSGDRTADARDLWRLQPDWRSEPFILVEFANVLATYVRVRSMPLRAANETLAHARRVIEPGLHPVDQEAALALAAQYGVSAYDARFLSVAQALGARLTTEDAKLRHAAPLLTLSIEKMLDEVEAAHSLAQLGGSDPEATAAPRRRTETI
jgi:predicted nucleic acid-binding protein